MTIYDRGTLTEWEFVQKLGYNSGVPMHEINGRQVPDFKWGDGKRSVLEEDGQDTFCIVLEDVPGVGVLDIDGGNHADGSKKNVDIVKSWLNANELFGVYAFTSKSGDGLHIYFDNTKNEVMKRATKAISKMGFKADYLPNGMVNVWNRYNDNGNVNYTWFGSDIKLKELPFSLKKHISGMADTFHIASDSVSGVETLSKLAFTLNAPDESTLIRTIKDINQFTWSNSMSDEMLMTQVLNQRTLAKVEYKKNIGDKFEENNKFFYWTNKDEERAAYDDYDSVKEIAQVGKIKLNVKLLALVTKFIEDRHIQISAMNQNELYISNGLTYSKLDVSGRNGVGAVMNEFVKMGFDDTQMNHLNPSQSKRIYEIVMNSAPRDFVGSEFKTPHTLDAVIDPFTGLVRPIETSDYLMTSDALDFDYTNEVSEEFKFWRENFTLVNDNETNDMLRSIVGRSVIAKSGKSDIAWVNLTSSKGGTGKTSFVNMLTEMMPDSAVSNFDPNTMHQRFQVQNFYHKSLITADELEPEAYAHADYKFVKSVTGKGQLSAEFKGVSHQPKFVNYGLMLSTSNYHVTLFDSYSHSVRSRRFHEFTISENEVHSTTKWKATINYLVNALDRKDNVVMSNWWDFLVECCEFYAENGFVLTEKEHDSDKEAIKNDDVIGFIDWLIAQDGWQDYAQDMGKGWITTQQQWTLYKKNYGGSVTKTVFTDRMKQYTVQGDSDVAKSLGWDNGHGTRLYKAHLENTMF